MCYHLIVDNHVLPEDKSYAYFMAMKKSFSVICHLFQWLILIPQSIYVLGCQENRSLQSCHTTMATCRGQVVQEPSTTSRSSSLAPLRPHRKRGARLKRKDKHNLMSVFPTAKALMFQLTLLPYPIKKANVVDPFLETTLKLEPWQYRRLL